MPKKYLWTVMYSVFVNGTEYPREANFYAVFASDAIDKCEEMLKEFRDPMSTYKIKGAVKA